MQTLTYLFQFLLLILSVSSDQRNLKNVLFIGIDDMRPELGVYGSNITKSPYIDKLASQSIVFERAY